MVRKTFSILSVLAVLTVFMVSCSKQAEYVNAIPADASVVLSIDLKSLVKKSGVNDKENEAMKQKLMDALKNDMTATSFQHLEKIVKSPAESGIDIKSPMYFFNSVSFPYPIGVVKVGNIDNLRASVEFMAKEQLCQPLTEGDGYSFALMGNDNLLAFNETTALFVGVQGTSETETAKQAITGLLKQTADNSIDKNTKFQKMQKSKGDIIFFASLNALPDMYARQLNMGLPSNINLKDMTIIGGLSFEKGKVAMYFENYSENEQINALLKEQKKVNVKPSNSFLKYFPESTLAFLNAGVNGSELYNLLNNNEEFRKNMNLDKASEIKGLLDSFSGDISIGLVNVPMMGNPAFIAYADVKNADMLKTLYAEKQQLGIINGKDLVQLSENEYAYKTKDMSLYIGVRDKYLYITNDELLYKNIGKAADKSVEDASYASDMKGKDMFFVVNAEAILVLPVIQMMSAMGGEEYQTYFNLASKVSCFEISATASGKTEVDLILKDKDVNALKQIIDFAKQFTGM